MHLISSADIHVQKASFLIAAMARNTSNCRPLFVFFVLPIFSQQVRVGGQNKIHSDHFPIELKPKKTQHRVSFDFNSIGTRSE